DLGRDAAAVDAGQSHRAVQLLLRAGLGVLAHDGDDGREVRGVAGEPGGLVLLGGAGLARGGPSGVEGGGGGAVLHDAAQHGRGGVGGLAADGLAGLPLRQLHRLPAVLRHLLDHGVRAVLAVVGERRVDLGHVQHAGGGHTERDGRAGGQRRRLRGQAEVDGGLHDLVGADVDGQLRVHGVDGLVGGLADGDVAVGDVVLVLRGVVARPALHGALVGAVVHRVGRDEAAVLGVGLVLDGGGEDDRLEDGADLVVPAGRVRGVLLDVVDAVVHRDDLAGLRVDGGAAGPHVGVDLAVLLVEAVHQLVVDGVDEGVLLVLLQRGGDAVAAPVEFVLADDPVLDEVVLDGADDVAALAGHAGGDGGLLRHGELHAGPLGLAEPALLDHAVQDVVPAGLGGLAVLRVGDHVVLAGRVDERGEVGGAAGVEVLGVHAVVGLGGGLDAVGVAAEV